MAWQSSMRSTDEVSSSDDKTPTARWIPTFASTGQAPASTPFKPTHSRRASRITVHLTAQSQDVNCTLASLQALALEQPSTDERMEEVQSHHVPLAVLPPGLVVANGRPRASTLSDLSDASTVRPSDTTTRVRRRSKTLFQARVSAQRRSRAEAAAGPRTPRRVSQRSSASSRMTSPNTVASNEDLDSMDDVLANFAEFIDSGYVSTSSPSTSSASPASRISSSPASTPPCGSPARRATRSLLAELEAWSSSDEDDDDTDQQTSPAESSIASSRRLPRKETFSTPEASPMIVNPSSRHADQVLDLPFNGHDALATLSSIHAMEKLSIQSARSMTYKGGKRSPAVRRLPPQRDPRNIRQLPLPPPPTPSKSGLSPRFSAHILQRNAQAMHRQRSCSSVSSCGRSSISYSSNGSSLLCIPGDEEAMALRDGLGSWSFDGEAGSRSSTPETSVSACGNPKPPRPARSPRRPSMDHFATSPKHTSRRSRTGLLLPDIKARSASLAASAALNVPAAPHTPVRTASLVTSPVQQEQIRAYRAASMPLSQQESNAGVHASSVAPSPKTILYSPVVIAAHPPRTPRSDFASSASVAEFVAGAEKASKVHAAAESLSPERAAPRFRERLAGLTSLSMRNLSSHSFREDAKAGSPCIEDDYVCPSPVQRQRDLSDSLSRGAGMRLRTASITSTAFEEDDTAPPSPRGSFSFFKRPSMSRLGQLALLHPQTTNTTDVACSPMSAPSSPAFRNPFSTDASPLPPNTAHDETAEQSRRESPSHAPSRPGLSIIGWGRTHKLSAADMLVTDFTSTRQDASSEALLSSLRRGSMLGRTLWA